MLCRFDDGRGFDSRRLHLRLSSSSGTALASVVRTGDACAYLASAARLSASASLPDVSPKLVHGHRFTRATATRATDHESELGRQLARRCVVSLLNVGRNAFGVGPIPEVANRGVHRLAADPLIAPFLGDPPTRFDLVRGDPLDALPGNA